MNESSSQPEKSKEERQYSQEQFKLLNRCNAEKDMSAWNEWREQNPQEAVLLEGAPFWHAYLKGVNLCGANLTGADLRGAKITRADLEGANLYDAKLQGARLGKSILRHANLEGADIRGTSLWHASLEGAKCDAAIVDGFTLLWRCNVDRCTNFVGVGLGSTRIRPGLRQLLEYNIRRMNWEKWYKWKDWSVDKPKKERNKISQFFLKKTIGWFWSISDYGRSTGKIIAWFFGLAFIFANLYYHWGRIAPPGIVENLFVDRNGIVVPSWLVPFRTLYFSIVTMTTLGFGDMYANAQSICGHILLSLQVILGYVLLGALVTRFAVLFTAGGPAGKFADEKKK